MTGLGNLEGFDIRLLETLSGLYSIVKGFYGIYKGFKGIYKRGLITVGEACGPCDPMWTNPRTQSQSRVAADV